MSLSAAQFQQLPMFMTAREIRDQYQGHDGSRRRFAGLSGGEIQMFKGRHETEDEMFRRKVSEAEERWDHGGDYLAAHVRKHGVTHAISLQDDPTIVGSLGKPQILGGHHRVAVMHADRPDELMPVAHFRDVSEAMQALKGRY